MKVSRVYPPSPLAKWMRIRMKTQRKTELFFSIRDFGFLTSVGFSTGSETTEISDVFHDFHVFPSEVAARNPAARALFPRPPRADWAVAVSAAHGNLPAICSLHGAPRVRNAPGLRLPFELEILEPSSQRIWLRPISSRHVWPVVQFAT